MDYNISNYKSKVVNHYSTIWNEDFEEKRWLKGPIMQTVPHFCVLEYKPRLSREMWTYATCGMSTYTHKTAIEVHMFSSKQDNSIIELLSAVCYYHNIEANLDLGHTVNFGRSWQDSSKASFGLLSLPYLDGPDLEIMHFNGNKDVHFYWLIPIIKAEVQYKNEFGLEALEAKFDSSNFNYVNPDRRSVI